MMQPDHWDFMIEVDGVLATWALSAQPLAEQRISTIQLPDHRRAYLEYEGPISGDRGAVKQWDRGVYRLVQRKADLVQVQLKGQILSGLATLTRASEDGAWWFGFHASRETNP